MAELLVAGSAAAGYLHQMWSYNQECYNFDKTMQQSAMHQRQQMRREWVFLFRDDINQMVDLTITRMDNYILTNTLQITLLVAIIGEGILLLLLVLARTPDFRNTQRHIRPNIAAMLRKQYFGLLLYGLVLSL